MLATLVVVQSHYTVHKNPSQDDLDASIMEGFIVLGNMISMGSQEL